MKNLIMVILVMFSLNSTANAAAPLAPIVMFPAFFMAANAFVDLDRPERACTSKPELLVKHNDGSNYSFTVTYCDYENNKDGLIVL